MPPSASATPSERTLAAAVAPPRAAAAAPDTRSLAERTALFPVLQAEAVLEAADERTRPAAGVHRARRQI
jgi:hypothetical protein